MLPNQQQTPARNNYMAALGPQSCEGTVLPVAGPAVSTLQMKKLRLRGGTPVKVTQSLRWQSQDPAREQTDCFLEMGKRPHW